MNGKEFIKALKNIIEEKSISEDVVYEAMEQGLISAYKKNYESKSNVKVEIDRKTGEFRVYRYYVVVDDYDDGKEITDEEGNITYEDPEINADAQILLEDALKKWKDAKVGDEFREEVTPHDFGRVAASTCKQVVVQKIREAEKNSIIDEYADKQYELLVLKAFDLDDFTQFVKFISTLVSKGDDSNEEIKSEIAEPKMLDKGI